MQEKEAVMEKESIDSNGTPEKGDSGPKLQGSAENTVCVSTYQGSISQNKLNFPSRTKDLFCLSLSVVDCSSWHFC